MLGITVAREESELEARREQLVLEDAENKRVQKEIEDTILDLLKNSEGNILDDEVIPCEDCMNHTQAANNDASQKSATAGLMRFAYSADALCVPYSHRC